MRYERRFRIVPPHPTHLRLRSVTLALSLTISSVRCACETRDARLETQMRLRFELMQKALSVLALERTGRNVYLPSLYTLRKAKLSTAPIAGTENAFPSASISGVRRILPVVEGRNPCSRVRS